MERIISYVTLANNNTFFSVFYINRTKILTYLLNNLHVLKFYIIYTKYIS